MEEMENKWVVISGIFQSKLNFYMQQFAGDLDPQ